MFFLGNHSDGHVIEFLATAFKVQPYLYVILYWNFGMGNAFQLYIKSQSFVCCVIVELQMIT